MLQENLVDFNPFRGILSVSRESDRSNIHVERTVASIMLDLIPLQGWLFLVK